MSSPTAWCVGDSAASACPPPAETRTSPTTFSSLSNPAVNSERNASWLRSAPAQKTYQACYAQLLPKAQHVAVKTLSHAGVNLLLVLLLPLITLLLLQLLLRLLPRSLAR